MAQWQTVSCQEINHPATLLAVVTGQMLQITKSQLKINATWQKAQSNNVVWDCNYESAAEFTEQYIKAARMQLV